MFCAGLVQADGNRQWGGRRFGTSSDRARRGARAMWDGRHSVREVTVRVVGRREAQVDGRGAREERVWPRAIASRNREAGAETTRRRREQVDGGWFVQCYRASQEQRRFRAWVIVFELEERQARWRRMGRRTREMRGRTRMAGGEPTAGGDGRTEAILRGTGLHGIR